MEKLRSFIQSLETRIRNLNTFRCNGAKRVRDFIRLHPLVAILAGIVGACAVPVLACFTFFGALFFVVFLSIQGTLAGLTCVAFLAVVGPVFITGLSVVIFGYIVLKVVRRVCRTVKYVASLPFKIWTKVIAVIEDITYSGQPNSFTAPTSYHASDSHSFEYPAQRPVNQTVRCQSDLPSRRINNDITPNIATVNARSNELCFSHSASVDGEPIRIRLSSSDRRTAFRDMFGDRDPVEVLWPDLPATNKERCRKRLKGIEDRVCQSTDDDSDLSNSGGMNENSRERRETPTRNKMKSEQVYRKTGGKPMHWQESDSESFSSQTDSGRECGKTSSGRNQNRSHFTSQEYRHRGFKPWDRGDPEGYKRDEQTATSSADDNDSQAYSSRTAWNNRKQQRVPANGCAKRRRETYRRRTKAQRFVMPDSKAESEADQLMRTSDSGRSSVSSERKRYRNEKRVHRIRSSETNSDSEQSDAVCYNQRKRKHQATKRNSDHEWERGTPRSHSSRDEPPFNKEPVPTRSGRRQLPNTNKYSQKSRDCGAGDHYREKCAGQRQNCCKVAEDGYPWDTRVAPPPSWASRFELLPGTDYDYVTTSDEREFCDVREEAASTDEEYIYY